MTDEIEQYLMAKFRDDLKSSSKVPLYSEFQKLQTLLEEKLKSSPSTEVLKLLRENLYRANNLLNECQMLSRRHNFYSPDAILAPYRIRRSLNNIKREVQGIIDAGESSNGATYPNQIREPSHSSSGQVRQLSTGSIGAPKVYGFKDEVMSLSRSLLRRPSEDRFKAIGIVGMAGIGKTTLAQVIFNQKEVKDNFVPRIWVCLSKQPTEEMNTTTAIAQRMLTHLGVEAEIIESITNRHGLRGLVFALHVELLGKRYLIVLDDAWSSEEWYGELNSWLTEDEKWGDRLAYGLPKGYGGTVIVTSRAEEIAKKMVGEEDLHQLGPLAGPESCWSIFKDAVEKDGTELPSNLENQKADIIQKCAGLPLAAKTMGEIMNAEIRQRGVGGGGGQTQ